MEKRKHSSKLWILCMVLCCMTVLGTGCQKSKEVGQQAVTENQDKEKEENGKDRESEDRKKAEDKEKEENSKKKAENKKEEKILRLGFAGDVNLDENWSTTRYLDSQENGIADCIDADIIEYTKNLDIFMLNNEFSYSDRGTPMEGKAYTFRAKPERVKVLKELGTDIVLLANNHVFDYGEEAFYDTLDTLGEAGIPYVGAGRNIEEACTPVYFEIGKIKIAYVAATRAEKLILTPEAGEDSPGVLRAYDPEKYLGVIKAAKEEADYVVASIHFGTEYSNQAEEYQRELARKFIDAGADTVIGSHAHVLQGIEYYNGKPIIYSLGNFWFNEKTLNSCVFTVDISDVDASLKGVHFLPCIQRGCRTEYPDTIEERRKVYDFMEDISFGIKIDDEGNVTEEEK